MTQSGVRRNSPKRPGAASQPILSTPATSTPVMPSDTSASFLSSGLSIGDGGKSEALKKMQDQDRIQAQEEASKKWYAQLLAFYKAHYGSEGWDSSEDAANKTLTFKKKTDPHQQVVMKMGQDGEVDFLGDTATVADAASAYYSQFKSTKDVSFCVEADDEDTAKTFIQALKDNHFDIRLIKKIICAGKEVDAAAFLAQIEKPKPAVSSPGSSK